MEPITLEQAETCARRGGDPVARTLLAEIERLRSALFRAQLRHLDGQPVEYTLAGMDLAAGECAGVE